MVSAHQQLRLSFHRKNKIWIKCGKKQGESYVSEASKGVVILKRRKCHLAVVAICIAQFLLIFADLTAVAQKRETNQSASFYLAKHVLAGCFFFLVRLLFLRLETSSTPLFHCSRARASERLVSDVRKLDHSPKILLVSVGKTNPLKKKIPQLKE